MVSSRQLARSISLVAASAALVCTACLPPIAFHDGLPAWSPEQGQVEWRVGYQELSAFGADSFGFFGVNAPNPNIRFGYLTPGVRWGLSRTPLAADVGLTSVMAATSGDFSLLVGPTMGIGHCDSVISVMFRPSAYVLSLDAGSGGGLSLGEWIQAEVLVGNGYRRGGVNFCAGGRISPYAVGPVGLVGLGLDPIDIRAELSYMLPASSFSTGQALTIGVTVAAPTGREAGHGQARP